MAPSHCPPFLPLWFVSACYGALASVFARVCVLLCPSPPPILKYESSPKEDSVDCEKPFRHDQYLDPVTGAFPSSPLPHLPAPFDAYESILAVANCATSPLSLGEDTSEEAVARRASSEAWRARIRALPIHDLTPLRGGGGDRPVLQRAHTVLAWLVHFYVHSTPPPPDKVMIVPAALAHPLVQVSRWLQIAPVLTYADTVLWNFELSDVHKPLSPNNMTFTTLFNKGAPAESDESEFYRCCAWIEQRGFDCTKRITDLVALLDNEHRQPVPSEVASRLRDLGPIVNDLTDILMSVKHACRPNSFYSSIRPWYRGSDPSEGGLRWVYEGVEGSDSLELSGPSAGQTSTFHALDALLGIQHDERSRLFMKRTLEYMPAEQRAMLRHLQHWSVRLKEMVSRHSDVRDAYNSVLEAMTAFRTDHLQVAVRYVVSPKDKCPISGMTVVAAGGACPARTKSRGTGGNEVSTVLKGSRDSTKRMMA